MGEDAVHHQRRRMGRASPTHGAPPIAPVSNVERTRRRQNTDGRLGISASRLISAPARSPWRGDPHPVRCLLDPQHDFPGASACRRSACGGSEARSDMATGAQPSRPPPNVSGPAGANLVNQVFGPGLRQQTRMRARRLRESFAEHFRRARGHAKASRRRTGFPRLTHRRSHRRPGATGAAAPSCSNSKDHSHESRFSTTLRAGLAALAASALVQPAAAVTLFESATSRK